MMKPRVKKTTLLLPQPLWLATKKKALSEDKSFRAIVKEALAVYLKAGKAVTK